MCVLHVCVNPCVTLVAWCMMHGACRMHPMHPHAVMADKARKVALSTISIHANPQCFSSLQDAVKVADASVAHCLPAGKRRRHMIDSIDSIDLT